MPGTIEEKVAYLEGKVEEHSRAWVDIKDLIMRLDQRVNFIDQNIDRFRDELSSRINSLEQHLSARLNATDEKINSLDHKISSLHEKTDEKIDALERKLNSRIDSLDQKFSNYFLWLKGIQVTIFLSIVAVFLKIH